MVADQAYVDAINAFSAAIAPLTDNDDIAAAKTLLDAAFTDIRLKAKAVANVSTLAADAARAQQIADNAAAAHAAAVAIIDAPAAGGTDGSVQ